MASINLALPRKTDAQRAVFSRLARFNVLVAGAGWGKFVLGQEFALFGPGGVLNGGSCAWCCTSEDGISKARRLLASALQPVLSRKPEKRRIDLITGGFVEFFDLSRPDPDLWGSYHLLVVDDAQELQDLDRLWVSTLAPAVQRKRGSALIMGRPRGQTHGLYRLFREARETPGLWSVFQRPSSEGRPAAVAQRMLDFKRMPAPLFAQEHEAEFLAGDVALTAGQCVIGQDETFLEWCERLEADGLKVDGVPFTLSDRPAMRFIYGMIPSTREEAYGRVDVIMKCAQVGFTVMEMLVAIYMALKFPPAKIGLYVPDRTLAGQKSSERFLPVVRTIPDAYRLLSEDAEGKSRGEGNVMIRNMGSSRFHFMWTSGKVSTESFPMDVLSFDEVQEMPIADMEKTRERLSASKLRYTLMGSTANWMDSDIHWWYKRGNQLRFWTRCPCCDHEQVLDDHFPACIQYNEGQISGAPMDEYVYACAECGGWIQDTQQGEWRPEVLEPERREIRSIHFPQFLSPTISPREIIEAYFNADDLKNFFNRKLGKPYTDPSQVPVNLSMLNACADAGMAAGVVWKDRATGTFMGIDQMGAFNVAVIKERMPDGRQALIHLEMIYSTDPFARCDELMATYGVQICVLETLPNYNDAKRFAQRHSGKVFLAGYGDLSDDMLRWGDTPKLGTSDRRTNEEERDRYTVTLDQYKCMQVSMARIKNTSLLFPDPQTLTQTVLEKGVSRIVAVLKDVFFLHATRTALIAEKDPMQKKFRRRVVKVGIDPHFSYANMLCDVAWARAHGTNTFILPQAESSPVAGDVAQLPLALVGHMEAGVAALANTCGACGSFNKMTSLCDERGCLTRSQDPACPFFTG